MNMIVAISQNWGISKNGKLLCHLQGDLKYFQSKTKGKHIIIGRKTLESFPNENPLSDRENIILTTNKDFKKKNCTICHSLIELKDYIKEIPQEEVFICGGESIYKQFINSCDTIYVTHILKTFDSDRHFENLDKRKDFKEIWRSTIKQENDIRYYFAKYEKTTKGE